MKKYFVVGFTEEKGQPVEMVPSSWVVEDLCYWPTNAEPRKIKSMIEKCKPRSSEWAQFPVKIYGRTNSLIKAATKVEKARNVSFIGDDSPEVQLKRKPKVPIRYRDTDSSDDCMNSQSLLENMRVTPKSSSKRVYTLPMPPSNSFLISEESNTSDEKENASPVPIHSIIAVPNTVTAKPTTDVNETTELDQGSSFSNFLSQTLAPQDTVLEKVLKHLVEIKHENRLMRQEIKKLREKVEMKLNVEENSQVVAAIGNIINKEEFNFLPLISLADLQELEDSVTVDAAKATALARFLCRGGGYNDANSVTLLIMKRLLSRMVAMQYSLEGRQNKLRFSDLNLFNVVIASVKMQFPETEVSKISSRIGKILAGSADWDGNRVRGKRKRVSEEETI